MNLDKIALKIQSICKQMMGLWAKEKIGMSFFGITIIILLSGLAVKPGVLSAVLYLIAIFIVFIGAILLLRHKDKTLWTRLADEGELFYTDNSGKDHRVGYLDWQLYETAPNGKRVLLWQVATGEPASSGRIIVGETGKYKQAKWLDARHVPEKNTWRATHWASLPKGPHE